jgi:hypothetical protein
MNESNPKLYPELNKIIIVSITTYTDDIAHRAKIKYTMVEPTLSSASLCFLSSLMNINMSKRMGSIIRGSVDISKPDAKNRVTLITKTMSEAIAATTYVLSELLTVIAYY